MRDLKELEREEHQGGGPPSIKKFGMQRKGGGSLKILWPQRGIESGRKKKLLLPPNGCSYEERENSTSKGETPQKGKAVTHEGKTILLFLLQGKRTS